VYNLKDFVRKTFVILVEDFLEVIVLISLIYIYINKYCKVSVNNFFYKVYRIRRVKESVLLAFVDIIFKVVGYLEYLVSILYINS